ncbi:MAG: hypothetical protein V1661_02380 [bacterium]
MNFKNKIIYLIYLLPAVALAYLFWQNTRPGLELNCDFQKKNPLCGELVPTARVVAQIGGIAIKSEPVYFDVRLPRKYNTVKMEIKYSDLTADIFEAGVSQDEGKKNFNFSALENRGLDNLGWNKIAGDGLVLYQRKPTYKSMADFLAKPADFNKTLLYRADAVPKLGKMLAKGNTVINFPVLEGLKMLVYKEDGAPEVRVGTGIESDFNKTIEDLGNGLWRINLSGSKEKVFTNISINSSFVTILDKIRLGKLEKPAELYLAGGRLLAMAEKADGARQIKIDGKVLNMENILEQYSQIFENMKSRSIVLEKGNVELNGTLFFLNDKNIFYPRFENFYAGANLSGIDYILARYSPPSENNGIKTTKAEFDIQNSVLANGKLRFLLSLPNAEPGELVKIKGIKLEFRGEKFSIKNILKKIFKLANPT